MHPALDIADCAELVRVTRNSIIESRHLGIAVVLGPDGEQLAAFGNPQALVFPRSALKPFQAIGSLRAGAKLSDEATALACASHVGTRQHQELAASMLAQAGRSQEDLQCPLSWPGDAKTRQQMISGNEPKNHLAFNCSGKHAAFLNAAIALDQDPHTYLDPAGAVQASALAAMEEFCGPIRFLGTDGCGAPAPQMSLHSLASGFHRLVASEDAHALQVASAIRRHPWAIRGPGSPNTLVAERTGIIAKLGAEGVLAMAAPSGHSVAVKMLDGSQRGTDLLALGLLASFGALEPEDHNWLVDQLTPEAATAGAKAAGLELKGIDF
ncbi:asparaginase [Glutamicibacter uratoxydans]|uniref:Asparaginase n=1 Tax=Glutamicibacter uratoxydans TaxID=43667 RepID=A0A4Y4DS07_GLUUR|nr:asparaginase [Glutamicibacter uratoxydans]GED05291.1 asparaginase [Glutamicibacter uratoxydans]